MGSDALRSFHPAVAAWFRESFGAPTPPQTKGWPRIAAGENTLILAPTGSGKTLAAFLCALDELVRAESHPAHGVHTLYVSPLKALANDIRVNLIEPLAGIRARATSMGLEIPEVSVGLRTGDTPPSERRRMLRHPPQILITTPESLHLLLTSSKAREILRTTRSVIIDEIHALCPNKRGTFLSLLLERLERLTGDAPQRIGLSATQRPLDLVARFLGGQDDHGSPRPVSIVDAGGRTDLDLQVVSPVSDFRQLPEMEPGVVSVWPAIYDLLLRLTEDRQSTLIFANSRRVVERVAAEMNRRAGHASIRAHHGSISREARLHIEQELKAGRLPALVATSSLELGIDVGAIDLVCQVESPFSVASGLQRIGRAGHLVRATSVGRLIPKTREDLHVMAAMTRAMLANEISPLHIPSLCLDILAQQLVAMTANGHMPVAELLAVVRRAYPYRDLSEELFHSVIEQISGRYDQTGISGLRPRVSLDPLNGVLHPLPGTRHAAILNGGAIPETGQYPMVLEDGKTRLGELDEEFVFERRLGEVFTLGTAAWRILDITHDRVVVSPSDAHEAQMPFWKAEGVSRDTDFGRRLGRFTRECADRLTASDFCNWVSDTCRLDPASATNLQTYLRAQMDRGVLPTDRTIVAEVFRAENGDPRLALLTPYGRAFHMTLLMALQAELRRHGAPNVSAVYSNSGLLFRIRTGEAEPLIETLQALRADEIPDLVRRELENSPLFALHFRRNAGRSLLLPRSRPGRRTPLWLQRLRSHDVLQVAAAHPGFPMVIETYRELTEDVLPIQAVCQVWTEIASGGAELVTHHGVTPSPFAASLLLDFTAAHLYQQDTPVPAQDLDANLDLVRRLTGSGGTSANLLSPDAIEVVEDRLQGRAPSYRARDGSELVELLRRLGDLSHAELLARCEPLALDALDDLVNDGRVVRIEVSAGHPSIRYVVAEDADRYAADTEEHLRFLVARYLASHVLTSEEELLERYPTAGRILRTHDAPWISVPLPNGASGWADPETLAAARRATLGMRHRRVRATAPAHYGSALLRRQHLLAPLDGEDALLRALDRLAGCMLPPRLWEPILRSRTARWTHGALDALVQQGTVQWIGSGGPSARVLTLLPEPSPGHRALLAPPGTPIDAQGRRILDLLAHRGALFLHQIASALDAPPSVVGETLWSLLWQGRVTNDSLSPAVGTRPRASSWTSRRGGRWGGGRWTQLTWEPREETEESLRSALRVLLERTGLLCREILAMHTPTLRWATAYGLLARMEWAGEAERGVFVSGLSGPQFAAPGFYEKLLTDPAPENPLLLHSLDPANPYGDGNLFPVTDPHGTRRPFRRHTGNWLVMQRGEPILAVEARGARLTPLIEMSPSLRDQALALLPRLLDRRMGQRSLRIREWDGQPVSSSAIAARLEEAGFMREDQAMILYPEY